MLETYLSCTYSTELLEQLSKNLTNKEKLSTMILTETVFTVYKIHKDNDTLILHIQYSNCRDIDFSTFHASFRAAI